MWPYIWREDKGRSGLGVLVADGKIQAMTTSTLITPCCNVFTSGTADMLAGWLRSFNAMWASLEISFWFVWFTEQKMHRTD